MCLINEREIFLAIATWSLWTFIITPIKAWAIAAFIPSNVVSYELVCEMLTGTLWCPTGEYGPNFIWAVRAWGNLSDSSSRLTSLWIHKQSSLDESTIQKMAIALMNQASSMLDQPQLTWGRPTGWKSSPIHWTFFLLSQTFPSALVVTLMLFALL